VATVAIGGGGGGVSIGATPRQCTLCGANAAKEVAPVGAEDDGALAHYPAGHGICRVCI